ncbi:hypothetical protein RB653_002900 [Dictyostelium firmibasis]|uniref:Uncharacterized protein n=1 Tax=Dictyostelium firmibasis TaxID=79012 RepID=A0AAN7TPM8_9MYCE
MDKLIIKNKNVIIFTLISTILTFSYYKNLKKFVLGNSSSLSTSNNSKYKAIYILNTNDQKKIESTLRNIKNAYNDPRLKDNLDIELIVFGEGVSVYFKSNPYEQLLLPLKSLGTIFKQCENTIKDRNINKNDLFDFVTYVPSANGEIILKQHQGYASIHPW